MDKNEFLEVTVGRSLYLAFDEAIRVGATVAELEEVSRAALAKAYRAMAKVGIEN